MKKGILELEPIRFAMDRAEQRYPGLSRMLKLCWNQKLKNQDYNLRFSGKKGLLEAADPSGFMYGLLDFPDLIETDGPCAIYHEGRHFIERRGIKFNLPLDARTPSYSDASDSAFEAIPDIWSMDYWENYLDAMAEHKFNVLTLWNLNPYPSMVRIPEFPEASLEDVMRSVIGPRPEMSGKGMFSSDMERGLYRICKMSIEQKISHWRSVMQYAKDRCIDVYIFTWNLFVYGTEHSGYGITEDQNNPITQEYIYRAVRAMLDTYPLLSGFGITAGENMKRDDRDIPFLKNTYERAINEWRVSHPERKIDLIHRVQYASFQQIQELYADEHDFYVSFKYSQAHMYSSTHPAFFRIFLQDYPNKFRYWLTLRDDDFYLLRWRDSSYTREYLAEIQTERIKGFYLGADGFTWGRDYTARQSDTHPLYLEKMWEKFDLWGQLSYHKDYREELLDYRMAVHIGTDYAFAVRLSQVWAKASRIIPIVNCVHWHDYDFQWYPEGCCMFLHPPVAKLVFGDIREFMECSSMPGSGYISVSDYVEAGNRSGISPLEAAEAIRSYAEEACEWLHGKACAGSRVSDIVKDIHLLGKLGLYYADKIEAAVVLKSFLSWKAEAESKGRAVELLRRAAVEWRQYAEDAMQAYRPQHFTRLQSYVDFRMFEKNAMLDIEFAEAMER